MPKMNNLNYNSQEPSIEDARKWLLKAISQLKEKCTMNHFLKLKEKNNPLLQDTLKNFNSEENYTLNFALYKKTIDAICQKVESKNDIYLKTQNTLIPRFS